MSRVRQTKLSKLLNSFYNSVYSRTNNFEFPQRINLTLAVVLVFVFGLTYTFRKKIRQLVRRLRDRKKGSSADAEKPKGPAWTSNLQVIATNLFFLYMPENINYVVCLLKNAHDFSNTGFLVFNLVVVVLFIKIFSDYLVFYIDTLVKILIKKNKNRKKKIVEKELEKQIKGNRIQHSFRLNGTQDEVEGSSKLAKQPESATLQSFKHSQVSARRHAPADPPQPESRAKLDKQNSQNKTMKLDDNFDFVDGIENLSDFEEELAANSFGALTNDEEEDREQLSQQQIIAVKGGLTRHPAVDEAAAGHQGHLVLPVPNQGGADHHDVPLLQEVRLLHHSAEHLLHQHDLLRLRHQHRRGVQGGLVHLHHLQGDPGHR